MINDKGELEITEKEIEVRDKLVQLLSGGSRTIKSDEEIDILEKLREFNLCYRHEDFDRAYNEELSDYIDVRSLTAPYGQDYVYIIPDFPATIGETHKLMVDGEYNDIETENDIGVTFDQLDNS